MIPTLHVMRQREILAELATLGLDQVRDARSERAAMSARRPAATATARTLRNQQSATDREADRDASNSENLRRAP